MTNYIARVVLHRIDDTDDYPELHTKMTALGFVRLIEDDSSKATYRLPGGMYFFDGALPGNASRAGYGTIQQVHDKIMEAVWDVVSDDSIYIQAKNDPPTVMLIDTNDIVWTGLPKAMIFRRPK